MIHRIVALVHEFGAMALLIAVALFAEGICKAFPGFLGSAVKEITAICLDPATQWMLVWCFAIYIFICIVSEPRARAEAKVLRCANPNIWLAAFVLLSVLPYTLSYRAASESVQMPVLMGGMVFGKGIGMWVRWRRDKIQQRAVFLISLTVYLLAVSALWQPERPVVFEYHGISRWCGMYDGPNLYGLLMGVGFVLAVGQIVQALPFPDGRPWKIFSSVFCLFAAIVCGIGLFKSYSRGAWVSVFAGLIYLIVQTIMISRFSVWFRRNWSLLALLSVSLLFLAFWQFHFSEQRPAQRLFSAANVNDFSWRNRATAWDGAVRMMMDKPLAGFGWCQAELDYSKRYRPPRLTESAAIETNDYLIIGISAGVPALVCFIACVRLSLRGKHTEANALASISRLPSWICSTCRAGAIILLVGFWFDGGLFKLPVAVVFWTLLELGRIESALLPPVPLLHETPSNDPTGDMSIVPKCRTREIWLRWLTACLAVLAAVQTTIYLGTPFLPVDETTLAVARHFLVQRIEAEDFEFLSKNPVWRGKRLKVLIDHVRLANYNRQVVNWILEDKIYQESVLSAVITGDVHEQLDWRRPLWEEFYPRIRHESSPEDAAIIVIKHLRERVTIAVIPDPPRDIPAIWLRQLTDQTGFEIIYVAALRSVGVPARLDLNKHAEYYDGNKWRMAPAEKL